jgi:N-methylhydantoinase B/oxoprolinase/acetone carboxylase alpha subunit
MVKTDPIQLAIFKGLFHSIAEEMGATLKRTAFSPNIKERRDYSTAIFDADGRMVAQGDHMPVHLGSMPLSVSAAITVARQSARSAAWSSGCAPPARSASSASSTVSGTACPS